MAVISKSIRRFNEFGGWLLFFAYLKMEALLSDTRALLYCIKEGREFKTAYPEMIGTVEKILAKKYGYILDDAIKNFPSDVNIAKPVPKIVWTCCLLIGRIINARWTITSCTYFSLCASMQCRP